MKYQVLVEFLLFYKLFCCTQFLTKLHFFVYFSAYTTGTAENLC